MFRCSMICQYGSAGSWFLSAKLLSCVFSGCTPKNFRSPFVMTANVLSSSTDMLRAKCLIYSDVVQDDLLCTRTCEVSLEQDCNCFRVMRDHPPSLYSNFKQELNGRFLDKINIHKSVSLDSKMRKIRNFNASGNHWHHVGQALVVTARYHPATSTACSAD